MHSIIRLTPICVAFLLAACGDPPVTDDPAVAPEIAPQDFVLLPCGVETPDQPCALAVAGGKRVLFGTPAGAAEGISPNDLGQLDAVFVFSLRAGDLEGLDEVRNASWRAGRETPLLVIGPNGIDAVATALNAAYEQADALHIVEQGSPPGGYDAAVLISQAYSDDGKVFDTGDVVVESTSYGYRMTYDQRGMAHFHACDAGPANQEVRIGEIVWERLSCTAADPARRWPLRAPLFILENQDAE
jgi:ribonuclease BN (tRNA processing enzyme)